MRLSNRTWPRLPHRELATISTTGAVFALVLVAVLGVGAGLSGRGTAAAPKARAEAAPKTVVADDLEPLVVEVSGAGEPFRLGARRFATAEALARALGPLATPGAEVFVRMSHDASFANAAVAVAACESAGFRSISLSAEGP